MEAGCLCQFPRMETGVSAGSGTWARSTLGFGGSFCGRLGPRKRSGPKLDDRPGDLERNKSFNPPGCGRREPQTLLGNKTKKLTH